MRAQATSLFTQLLNSEPTQACTYVWVWLSPLNIARANTRQHGGSDRGRSGLKKYLKNIFKIFFLAHFYLCHRDHLSNGKDLSEIDVTDLSCYQVHERSEFYYDEVTNDKDA